MSRVEHLALVERLRLAEFPVEPCRSSGGCAGPGFSLALLPLLGAGSVAVVRDADDTYGGCEFTVADEGRSGEWAYELDVEQAAAEVEALGAALARGWGEPFRIGLDGLLLRHAERGEVLPHAWVRLSERASWALVWQDGGSGRWTAVGVGRQGPGARPVLVVLVTDADPP